MAQYKVPQNVEAEDKILGPLTFKQFIYGMAGFGWGALCFAVLRSFPAILILVGFPPTMFLLLLAFYNKDGQNFEQIFIAMLGFFVASRKRLWVKEDIAESFRIEPHKIVVEQTQRDPRLVLGELEKISTLIDSRGWNKRPEETDHLISSTSHEDRIVAPPPPKAPDAPSTDILDLQHSPLAQNLAELIREAADDVRAEAVDQMNAKVIPALPVAAPALAPAGISTSGVTQAQPNDILRLATQSDDLTVSQLAAQAVRLAPVAEGQEVSRGTNGV